MDEVIGVLFNCFRLSYHFLFNIFVPRYKPSFFLLHLLGLIIILWNYLSFLSKLDWENAKQIEREKKKGTTIIFIGDFIETPEDADRIAEKIERRRRDWEEEGRHGPAMGMWTRFLL
jgi:hypothetical protein